MSNKSNFTIRLTGVLIILLILGGCKKAEPPTLDFTAEVDGFNVSFVVQATNVSDYEWDYGDGNTSTAAGSHTYTYAEAGTYTVTLKVIGDGGEAQKSVVVTILPSPHDLLTGGPDDPDGKTWKLSKQGTHFVNGISDGASYIVPPDFSSWVAAMAGLPFPDSVLSLVGMGEEYDNLYTFRNDGTLSIDTGNGKIVSGFVYAKNEAENDIVFTTTFGLYQINYSPPSGMGFSVKKGNISMDIATEVPNADDALSNVNIENVNYLEFSGGGFIGIKDYLNKSIIRSITEDRMVITVFVHGSEKTPGRPSIALTVSFDAI
jgi:PKD repeat protein